MQKDKVVDSKDIGLDIKRKLEKKFTLYKEFKRISIKYIYYIY